MEVMTMDTYRWQNKVSSIGDAVMPSIHSQYKERQITAEEAIAELNLRRKIAYKHIPDEKVQQKESINDLCVFYTEKIKRTEKARTEDEYRMYI